MDGKKCYKIVYCTPSLYMAGGVERVLTLKANYFAEQYGYDITIITTDGKDKPMFFPLSEKVKVINLDINFEELWHKSLLRKILLYLPKQYKFKKALTAELERLRPDIAISMLRREINFITKITDGSKKVGEMHINRAHYRNFTPNRTTPFKKLFAKLWMSGLVEKVKRLDQFVVLTDYDCRAWPEMSKIQVIPNPLPFFPKTGSSHCNRRVIAVGRYFDEKGYDLLLHAWALVEEKAPEWRIDIFGEGIKAYYEGIAESLGIDKTRCKLHDNTTNVETEYLNSSIFVSSSRFEGFGMGIIEAMACGLPVVAFDCPWGPRSIITDGEDGLLVENGNVKELASKLLMLMGDKEKRIMMGANARKNVARYKIEYIAEKWRKLFDSL